MEEALKECKTNFTMTVVTDGVEAMDYLRQRGKYAEARRPDLVLLDLNLPKKDGREVLDEIKTDENLANVPVVVLTSSTDEDDIRMSYELQANCFISKPVNLDEFANVVKMIENFWGSLVRLP
jgi:two-component system response regulator